MDYSINHILFSNAFAIPADVADKYLKFCKGEHLKVLLYIMRNIHAKPTAEDISNNIDLSLYDVNEALLFWADAGILICEKSQNEPEKQKTVSRSLKPSREDVTSRGLEDPKLQYLLNQSQMILGRNLKGNELETFGWLYEDLGLPVSVILYIVQYSKQIEKANIRFIERIATDWVDKGVETIEQAEEQVRLMAMQEEAWAIVCKAFGIERRKPTKKENEYAFTWVNDWKLSLEMLEHAYETCVDTKSKFSFAYVAKVLENWHNSGYKTVNDIVKKPKQDKMQGAYNIDLFEELINSKD